MYKVESESSDKYFIAFNKTDSIRMNLREYLQLAEPRDPRLNLFYRTRKIGPINDIYINGNPITKQVPYPFWFGSRFDPTGCWRYLEIEGEATYLSFHDTLALKDIWKGLIHTIKYREQTYSVHRDSTIYINGKRSNYYSASEIAEIEESKKYVISTFPIANFDKPAPQVPYFDLCSRKLSVSNTDKHPIDKPLLDFIADQNLIDEITISRDVFTFELYAKLSTLGVNITILA